MPIRLAESSDFDLILNISENIFLNILNRSFFNWPRQQMQKELNVCTTLIAESNGFVCSFLCYRDLGDIIEVTALGTEPSKFKNGYQSEIINILQGFAAAQRARIILEVHSQNEAALALYKKKCFKTIHRRKGYYIDGGDAIVMEWNNQ